MHADLLSLQALVLASVILLAFFGQRALSSWRTRRRERRKVRNSRPG